MTFFNKKKPDMIFSPINGRCVTLDEVPDKTFSSKMIGDGLAFIYDGNTIYSPCYGEVIMIASTKHALAIKMKNGAELLLHIGLETVLKKGKGFRILVDLNQRVRPGQKLVVLDRQEFKGLNLITPLLVANTEDYEFDASISKEVKMGEELFEIKNIGV